MQEKKKDISVYRQKKADDKVYAFSFAVQGNNTLSKSLSSNIPATDTAVFQYLKDQSYVKPPYDPSIITGWLKANTTHSACINSKTSMIAGNGIEILAPESEQTDAFKRFLENPNEIYEQTLEEIIYSLVMNGEIFNNAYMQVRKAGSKVALYNVNAKNIFIRPLYDANDRPIAGTVEKYLYICRYNTPFGLKDTYQYNPYRGTMKATDTRLYHIKGASVNSDFYGEPTYTSIEQSILESRYVSDFNINFFSNNAQPNYVIAVSGVKMSKTAKEAFVTEMQEKLKGIENQHRGMVMMFDNEKANITIKEMSKSYDESFSKLKKDIAEVVSTAHLMPMELLPQSGSSNFGGGTATIGALKVFLEMIVKPRQRFYENNINRLMKSLFGFDPKIRLRGIKITTEKDDAIVHVMYHKQGILTTNEIREELKKKEMPISDTTVNDSDSDSPNVTDEGEPRAGMDTSSTSRELTDTNIDKF
jgi:capsid portal protein